MSKTTNPVRPYIFTLQDMAHSTDFPGPEGARAKPLTAISWYIWRFGYGDLGIDPHTDSSDKKEGPETYTEGMAPSTLFQTTARNKTSGVLVVFGEYGFLCVESDQDLIGTGLDCLHPLDGVEDI